MITILEFKFSVVWDNDKIHGLAMETSDESGIEMKVSGDKWGQRNFKYKSNSISFSSQKPPLQWLTISFGVRARILTISYKDLIYYSPLTYSASAILASSHTGILLSQRTFALAVISAYNALLQDTYMVAPLLLSGLCSNIICSMKTTLVEIPSLIYKIYSLLPEFADLSAA